jgi:histone acetyltransferase (RNA polymerase elongator complex component)
MQDHRVYEEIMVARPLILPVFLPHAGCRRRCLFCNQRAVAAECPSPEEVRGCVETALLGLPAGHEERVRQVAFYGGSFTAMPIRQQEQYLQVIQPLIASGRIDSIRISTRPDCLDEVNLPLLKKFAVRTVEIGAQSMIDEVLLLSRRGHRTEETLACVLRLREWGFETGLHLMIGLPGDCLDSFLRTLDLVIPLRPGFIRIHPTLVLKGAPLERLWERGKYLPLSLEEAVAWLSKGLIKLGKATIPVARVGLQPDQRLEQHLVAGPYHPALHQMVDSAITYEMTVRLLRLHRVVGKATFVCNPKEVSNLRGQRNRNISELKSLFEIDEVSVRGDECVARDTLVLETQSGKVEIRRSDLVS